jgi:Transposase DDE domain.
MQKVKKKIPEKLMKGIPLTIRPGHTIRLKGTNEPLTVHTGLSLFYAMAETLKIPKILDSHVRVKQRDSGYPESEHILALAANAFVGGDFLDDLEALREDDAIKMAIGRKEIPDPTTAGDFCRRFKLGHILQINKAFAEIEHEVYKQRKEVSHLTVDVDAKVHEVYGKKKQGAAKAYNGVYSLQPMYAFADETDELLHVEVRSGNTHPGAKAVSYLRRLAKKISSSVEKMYFRSDSAFYNREVVEFCEEKGWEFSITADQTAALLRAINALAPDAWRQDTEDAERAYGEFTYNPVKWKKAYRYLVRREREKEKHGQKGLFEKYSYYVVVTNKEGEVKPLMKAHASRGRCEKRIGQFTNEFLSHLPLGEFMANWVYLLCAQLAYNLSLWIRDLVLPKSYRKKHIKRIRRTIGLIASKVVSGGRQISLRISLLHHWWRDFVQAWEKIPMLNPG